MRSCLPRDLEQQTGTTYELTGPRAWSFDELAAIASAVAGKPIVHRSISAEEMTALRLADGLPESAVKAIVDIYRAIGDGSIASVTPDLEKLIGRSAMSVEESTRAAFG